MVGGHRTRVRNRILTRKRPTDLPFKQFESPSITTYGLSLASFNSQTSRIAEQLLEVPLETTSKTLTDILLAKTIEELGDETRLFVKVIRVNEKNSFMTIKYLPLENMDTNPELENIRGKLLNCICPHNWYENQTNSFVDWPVQIVTDYLTNQDYF